MNTIDFVTECENYEYDIIENFMPIYDNIGTYLEFYQESILFAKLKLNNSTNLDNNNFNNNK